MKRFEVALELWRESFSGRDYCDGTLTHTVEARNSTSAIKKAQKKLEPGKGMRWSQSRWSKVLSVKEICMTCNSKKAL